MEKIYLTKMEINWMVLKTNSRLDRKYGKNKNVLAEPLIKNHQVY